MTRPTGSTDSAIDRRPRPGRRRSEAAAERLTVRLLGGVEVRFGDERLESFEAPRLGSLLSYLLLHRHAPQPRSHLAFLFWPDSSEAQARTNLRQLVHNLRRAIPGSERFLTVGTGTIQWRPDSALWLDVDEFERRIDLGFTTESEAGLEPLEEAAKLYMGDLLPGVYDEWALQRRDELRSRHLELRQHLADVFETRRDWRAAILHTEALVRSDPLHEASYRRLMRLHALRGDRPRALRVYDECALVLEHELGVAPERATRAARDSLLEMKSSTEQRQADSEWPLIGRIVEWDRMMIAWGEAAAGHPVMMSVVGEPGIGKTRLVDELAAWCSAQGISVARARSYAIEGGLAFGPVVEWLRSDALLTRLAGLEDVWKAELSRLLPELDVPDSTVDRPTPANEPEKRQRLFEALARALLNAEDPLLLVFDDFQWADRDTLAFLHYLLRSDPMGRILVAGTARIGDVDQDSPAGRLLEALIAEDRLRELRLEPLGLSETGELLSVLGETEISDAVLDRLHSETSGNPLFVVELVRAGLRSGWEQGDPSPLPPRLRSLIEGRLGRLTPNGVVDMAAVIGREFEPDLLRLAGGFEARTLADALDELRHRGIIVTTDRDRYDFSHDRIREVAYEMVGPERRRQLHRDIADALVSSPQTGSSERAAIHYERAGDWDEAITFHMSAAESAQLVFANDEAIASLNRAIGLLDRLPPGRDRDERELQLLTAIGVPMVITEGYAPGVYDLYTRARELCDRLGRPTDPPILRALAIACIARCDLDEARRLGEELESVASQAGDDLLRVESGYVLGVTALWKGDFVIARSYLEAASTALHPDEGHRHVAKFAQDPQVICLSRLAQTLFYLGYPTQAAARSREALALGARRGHPFSLAYAMWFGLRLADELGDEPWLEELLATAKTLTGEQGLSFRHEPLGVVFDGWLRVRRGDSEGLDQMRSVTTDSLPIDQAMHASLVSKLLAEAYVLVGDAAAALDTVRKALRGCRDSGQRYQEAELHRIEATAQMTIGASPSEIEKSLARALDVSRHQGALALELRAANTLARWHVETGSDQQMAASDTLGAVFARFTEGHETPDLQEARDLLDRLGE